MDAEFSALADSLGLDDAARTALLTWADRRDAAPEPAVDLSGAATLLRSVASTEAGEGPTERVAPVAPAGGGGADRYEDLGLLGMGAAGEVRRVRDRVLGRTVAMKILKATLLEYPRIVARFFEEAQAGAQLQHPGTVPVHDVGRLPDGRLYFTMREIRGRTLHHVLHLARSGPAAGWTRRRLLDVFQRVCETVAYAHSRGVVHRDLKPANVMVGAHGEVLVVDWGLAKVAGRVEDAAEDVEPVATARSSDHGQATRHGTVQGTPAYMAPEQARGHISAIGPHTDVYALGAILYELLSGRPAYDGGAEAVLAMVLAGPPPPLAGLATGAGGAIPPELVEVAERAMARVAAARFSDASGLSAAIAAWLDGARRRERARALVAQAQVRGPQVERLRTRARTLRAAAEAQLSEVPSWHPAQDRAPAWTLEDEAATLEHEAEVAEFEVESLLRGALTHAPDLPEAHAALAAIYRLEHAAAESAGRDATRAELLLEDHALALPSGHPDRVEHLAWLEGRGTLSLVTEPPGATVELQRYATRARRLVPESIGTLGTTPLTVVPLDMGRYRLVLRAPGREAVLYPVHIGRQEHWTGRPPGARRPEPIVLPAAGSLGADDCHVPAGWFRSGGDPHAANGEPARRLWCPAFVIRRFPVTNAEYIRFLDDLVARGRRAEALEHAPRERGASPGQAGALVYGFDGGRFSLEPDADGDCWELAWPVMMVTWSGAAAYSRWLAARTGLPWRLPSEHEWEKAARGVDGRTYPWGETFDPAWACTLEGHAGRALPQPVGSHPDDVGPYGVRAMAGGMREWCATRPERIPADHDPRRAVIDLDTDDLDSMRAMRGGCWSGSSRLARVAARAKDGRTARSASLGFRLARSLP